MTSQILVTPAVVPEPVVDPHDTSRVPKSEEHTRADSNVFAIHSGL